MEKYIQQKSQKIVSALYMITDFIKDNDAIKWEIREEGIILISHAMIFNTALLLEKEHASKLFSTSADKIISYLNIASTASLISKMNTSIVIHEIESLVNFIHKEEKENPLPGYILSDSFFATDVPEPDHVSEMSKMSDKGHSYPLKTKSIQKDNVSNYPSLKKDKQKDRTESIINLLKKSSNLTIKDFTQVIKDCSEKTIQRDLISLVEKGIVKREGERRWSTYSLNSEQV